MKRGLNVWEVSEPYKLMKPLRRVINNKEAFPHIFASFPPIYQISHIIGLDSIPTFHNFLIESQIILYSVWSLQALTGP